MNGCLPHGLGCYGFWSLVLMFSSQSLLYFLLFSAKQYWLAPLLMSSLILLIPVFIYLSYKNEYVSDVIYTGWTPIIAAMAISWYVYTTLRIWIYCVPITLHAILCEIKMIVNYNNMDFGVYSICNRLRIKNWSVDTACLWIIEKREIVLLLTLTNSFHLMALHEDQLIWIRALTTEERANLMAIIARFNGI